MFGLQGAVVDQVDPVTASGFSIHGDQSLTVMPRLQLSGEYNQ
jgi:hypothetical protein